ncbi:peptidylprolyl isomerase [Helicobacter sp. 16-1353]|uniref:FKBP-type peptidyl-prolyl cis-trans isomerase n=1 Tax=Helicobacter sp. 16-1353 TaxID=2004996 RepID=UPI000DCC86F5|nr:peptidylprolyl isomerase [Helicobacter sp. 16-1353]RAX54085.1 peptidylprolyl isomerase [Helicobacter sp. 16-1353]
MSKIEKNHLVAINYTVTDKSSGEILDSNKDEEQPFTFLLGQNQVIIGLENALIGKAVGSNFKVEIKPEDAYGIKNPDFLQEVPKDQFSGIELVKGMTLFGQSEDGQTIQVIVDEIGEDSIMVDYNHPLAGKTLLFDVEVLSSKEPTQEEILELTSSSCGCGHSSGECCGGSHHKDGESCCGKH